MGTLVAPSGASEPLRHAVEMTDRDVDELLTKLDTSDQNLFWGEVERYAASQIGQRANVPLAAGEHIPELVREALRDVEMRMLKHFRGVSAADRDQFWRTLQNAAGEQAAQTRRPKARAGGGTFQI